MYKRITHDIVEEHYDHPTAGMIKKSIVKSMIPNNDSFDEIQFRTNVQNYVNNYANSLNQLIDSMKTSDNLTMVFENFFAGGLIDQLGNMTKPFINSELAEKINVSMRSIIINIISAIHSASTGQDINYFKFRTAGTINQLISDLRTYNSDWSSPNFNPLPPTLVDEIFNKINAVALGNTQASVTSGQQIYNDFSNFGTFFSDGLIKRFPNRFFKPSV